MQDISCDDFDASSAWAEPFIYAIVVIFFVITVGFRTVNATPLYDTIIVGGGPGGSTGGAFLGKAGQRVLLLEREVFPRFHIGESLLRIWE